MELRQLRYFVAIAERLNFTRAAEDLLIAQPALSAQMQKLEAEVGAPLFVRDKRHVELTDVGRLVLDEARATLEHAQRTLDVARAGASGTIGRLTIGYNRSFPFRPVAAIVKAFRSERPQVDLVLVERPNRVQFEALVSGDLDVGFVMQPPEGLPDTLERYEVASYPAVVAVAADHPLASRSSIRLSELAAEPFVVANDRSGSEGHFEQVVAACRTAGFTPAIVQEAAEVRIVLGLVAAGLGVSIMSGAMRDFSMRGLRLIALEPGRTLRYALVWPRAAANSLTATFVHTAQLTTGTAGDPPQLVSL